MAISASPVQVGDSGAGTVASGTAWTLASDVTAGNSVVLVICTLKATANDVSAVTSTFGTFTRQKSVPATATGADCEIWTCLDATGGGNSITVTSASGSEYFAAAGEWSGVGSVVSTAGTTGTGTSIALAFGTVVSGNLAVGTCLVNTTFSAAPASPWTNYSGGNFTNAGGNALTYQVAASSGSLTASWTQSSSSGWQDAGIVLAPTTAVTGTASVTLGALSLTATSKRTTFGSGAVTLGALSLTATSQRTTFGSATVSLGALSLTATGTSATTVTGTATVTIGALSVSAVGQRTTFATASIDLGALGIEATGVRTTFGVATVDLGAFVVSVSTLPARDVSISVGPGFTGWTAGPAYISWTVYGAVTSWNTQEVRTAWDTAHATTG